MRVLLLCNGIMEEVKEKLGLKHGKPESWINGICWRMKKTSGLEVMYLFPQNSELTFTDGNITFRSYSQKRIDRVEQKQYDEFTGILRSFKPDVVHIFGTEHSHTLAMVRACEELGCLGRVVIHIQGLVQFYSYHYSLNVPIRTLCTKTFRDVLRGGGIRRGQKDFQRRGISEAEAIRRAGNITGRTDWDEACVKSINPGVRYFHCNEMLRDTFYESPKWSAQSCERHSIFISQSSYPIKGFHIFLQALPEIIRRYPDVHVYTTGTSPIPKTLIQHIKQTSYRKYLTDIIRKNNLENYITFTGYLDEERMCERFRKSHVFILPSTIENSPNSLGEAMILGVPCISSDVGGVKNMMTHGTEGFTYPADEPYMIPYYVDKIFSDDELAGTFSRNEISHASRTHDREEIFATLMGIYREISGTH